MDRTITCAPKSRQAAADLAYWLARPMAERIGAVEALREQALRSAETPDAEPRLQ